MPHAPSPATPRSAPIPGGRSRARRSVRPLGCLVLAAVVVGGCGVDGVTERGRGPGGQGSAASLRRAVGVTHDLRTLKTDTTVWFILPGVADSMSSRGEYDRAAKRSREVYDKGQLFVDRFDDGSEDLPRDAARLEEVRDGSTRYVRSSLYNHLTGTDEPWHRAKGAGGAGGGEGLGPAMMPDSGELMEFLDDVAKVSDAGQEPVRGVATTRLRAQFDLRDLLVSRGESRKEVDAEMRASGMDGPVPTGLDVWVDAQDRVRKISLVVDLASMARPENRAEYAGIGLSMTVELYAFDEAVDIEVPPPGEVGSYDPSILEGD